MSDAPETVVVGGGQAGLSVSHELSAAGIPHVVLERGQVGQTWRGRWDSFCLVTPNWSVQLPGHPYDGDDPDGFMPRDEIVGYLERYAAGFDAPVREGVEVTALRAGRDGRLAARHLGRRDRGPERDPQHRRVPAAEPPGGRGVTPTRAVPDRRRGIPQPGRAARRRGARGGQRPVRVPDLRGAPPRRSRRVPRLRPRGLGTPADQRTGHRLVAGRVRQLRRPRRGPA